MVTRRVANTRNKFSGGEHSFRSKKKRIVNSPAVKSAGENESMKSGDTMRLPSLRNGRSNSTGTGPWRDHTIEGTGWPFIQPVATESIRKPQSISSPAYPWLREKPEDSGR